MGIVSVDQWREQGGEGSSDWWKGNEWVSKKEIQERAKKDREERTAAVKERKRAMEEKRKLNKIQEERRKKEEQVQRSLEARRKSADRHRQVTRRVIEDTESRGGMFDTQWKGGVGGWHRTEKIPKRGMSWVGSIPSYMSVHEAKMEGLKRTGCEQLYCGVYSYGGKIRLRRRLIVWVKRHHER